jgi:hypothetical protein
LNGRFTRALTEQSYRSKVGNGAIVLKKSVAAQ